LPAPVARGNRWLETRDYRVCRKSGVQAAVFGREAVGAPPRGAAHDPGHWSMLNTSSITFPNESGVASRVV